MENIQKKQTEFSVKDVINNLSALFRYLRSKWKIILICAVTGGLAGLGYAIFKKPIYTASLDFSVEDNQQSGMGISGLAEQFGVDVGGSKSTLFDADDLVVFFQSRAMVQKTLLTEALFGDQKEVLVNRYITFNKFRKKWSGKPGLENISFTPGEQNLSRLQDSVLGEFYKHIIKQELDVNRVDKKLSIITLTYKSKDELFAKAFAENLTTNVVNFYILTQTGKSQHDVDVLQRQTDSVRRVLNASISGMAESTDQAPNANPLRQVLMVPSQKKAVDVEASKDVMAELIKNLELSKITLRKATPLIQYIDQPILPLENDKVTKTRGVIWGLVIGALIGVFVLSSKKALKSIMA